MGFEDYLKKTGEVGHVKSIIQSIVYVSGLPNVRLNELVINENNQKGIVQAAEEGIVESYRHAGGKVGVLLKLNCETDFVAKNELFQQLAHDLALHIAGMNPLYISMDDIPEDTQKNERRIYGEQFSGSGKPQEIVDKIIEGKMQSYAAEIALLEQSFVKDQDKKIKDMINEYIAKLGENIKVGGFVRYEI